MLGLKCGATLCDFPGDWFDQNPHQMTENPVAVKKLFRIITGNKNVFLIESIKNQGSFRCSYKWIAQAEVNLIWAAAEYQELGWRHAREAFAAAERLVDRGSYESQQCGSNQ